MLNYPFKKIMSAGSIYLLLLFPLVVGAQARVMTLEEVLQAGLDNSRQLQVSAARIAAAQAKVAQYRDQLAPSLVYSGSYYRLSDNITPFETPLFSIPVLNNQTQNRIALSETVFTGFRAKNTIEAGTFLANAAKFDADRDKADVKINLISAALNLYKLQEAVKVLDRNLAAAINRQTDLTNLRTQGLAIDNDVLKSELAVAQIQSAITETDNAIRAAQFSLSVLCNLPENTEIRIDSSSVFAAVENQVSLQDYLSNASNTAGVRASKERSAAAARQIAVSKGIMLPVVTLGANYYYNNPNQRQFPITDKFIGTWDVGVGVSWTLSGFYTSRHMIQESRANQIQNEALSLQLTDAVRSDIAANFYSWQSGLQKINTADKAVLSATENQRILQLRQTQQIATASDLLEADALLLQSQINAVSARADARSAWYRLQKSAGRL